MFAVEVYYLSFREQSAALSTLRSTLASSPTCVTILIGALTAILSVQTNYKANHLW